MIASRELHNLALIGFMGSGKSSVGRLLAASLRFDFVDTDEWIEKEAGRTIAQIFAESGEPAFREMEGRLVEQMQGWRRTVIATGGGLGAKAEHVASLKRHALVVCLWAPPEAIWQRVRSQTHRPLLQAPNPLEKIEALLAERRPVYCQADVLINTTMRSTKEVAQQVIHQFQLARTHVEQSSRAH